MNIYWIHSLHHSIGKNGRNLSTYNPKNTIHGGLDSVHTRTDLRIPQEPSSFLEVNRVSQSTVIFMEPLSYSTSQKSICAILREQKSPCQRCSLIATWLRGMVPVTCMSPQSKSRTLYRSPMKFDFDQVMELSQHKFGCRVAWRIMEGLDSHKGGMLT